MVVVFSDKSSLVGTVHEVWMINGQTVQWMDKWMGKLKCKWTNSLSINVDPFYISFKWTDWFINGQMCDVWINK